MILSPFILLSLAGLLLSIVVHAASFANRNMPPRAWGLHIGIFFVWVPTVIVANRLAREFKQRDFWKAALRGCPRWMKYMTYGLFVYAFVNFLLFLGGVGNEARGFSGHWMIFYWTAFAVMYSATQAHRFDRFRRCPSGHRVSPLAKFCEDCGLPIDATPSNERRQLVE